MCGIAGIVSTDRSRVSAEQFRSATACLRHRGPQGEGVWINEESTVALGHVRLSIIDLSEEAAQPMHYLDRYTIVHNGEIYNYLELKETLRSKGYHFKTSSDTEVITAAYDAFGEDCLQQFDGMFAFAIWDEKEKKLFAARDRFGEKPFFFFYDDKELVFASEMRSLWNMDVKKELNPSLLYNFLTIGYVGNPSDPQESFYSNVQKLPTASYLSYSPHQNELRIEKYWQIYPEVKSIGEKEGIEKFQHLFSESVRKRLRSDVAIGTSLSGGLDSSSIVAFCKKFPSDHYSHKCFTASFNGFEKDEARYASIVAKEFGLEHHIVAIDENEIADLMKTVMHHQEEPFSTASVLAQFKVFQSAKENGVTVLLDGQGADETLAGYSKYYKWFWQELYRNKQLGWSKEIEAARALGVSENFGWKNKIAARYPDFVAGIQQTSKAKRAFHHPDLDREFAFSNKQSFYYTMPSQADLDGALFHDSFVNGLEELLRLADRNSMAHAVEVRLPFLNHELVEFLFSLPPSFKIHEGWTKWLLRKGVDGSLPAEITWRKDKQGFEPPQKKWMENKEVQESIQEGKKKLVDHHILQASALHKKIKPHDSYAANGWDWKYWSASFLFD